MKYLLLVATFSVFFTINTSDVLASKSASVSVNTSTYVLKLGAYSLYAAEYAYGLDLSPYKQPMNSNLTPLSTTPPIDNIYLYDTEWYGLESAYGTVQYKAKLIDNNTGLEILDNATVPTGTVIRVERDTATIATDISWVGTGSLNDSPFGYWVSNAGGVSRGCYASDFVGGWGNTFFLFTANPPLTNVTSLSPNLSCAGNICTVNNTGPVSVRLNVDSTYGRFYQRVEDVYTPGTCLATNVPLGAAEYNGSLPFRKIFSLPIPATNIAFNLTAVAGNNVPNVPTLTHGAVCNAGQSYVLSAQGTDPDGDQVYYEFDINNDGVADGRTPGAGFVNSGTLSSLTVTPMAGVYQVRARAVDSKGGRSGWSVAQTVSCAAVPPAPTLSFSAAPTSVLAGGSSTLAWATTNAQSCWATGSWTGWKTASGGTELMSALTAGTKTYVLECWNASGVSSGQRTATVTVSAPNVLQVCRESSPVVQNGGTYGPFVMPQNTTTTFTVHFDATPGTCEPASNVTASAVFTEANPAGGPVSFSGTNPKTLSAAPTSGSESTTVSYSGQSAVLNAQVTCVETVNCNDESAAVCRGEFVPVGTTKAGVCGPVPCGGLEGTRYCDFNWKEVAPGN